MKITFLGTNGWYSTPTGETPCILIDAKEHYVVLDAGNGIYRLGDFIKEDKPISLFISHFHIDHTSGLHVLMPGLKFDQGMNIYMGSDRKKDFETISGPPFTTGHIYKDGNIAKPQTKFKIQELKDGVHDLGFKVEVIEMFHGYRDHGYKFTIEDKTISYTGDCGDTKELKKLAKNSDVLIAECSSIKSPENDPWGHLDPTQSAKVAKENNVKKLILTHFAADKYLTINDRKVAEQAAKKIFPNTIAAKDLMEFNI